MQQEMSETFQNQKMKRKVGFSIEVFSKNSRRENFSLHNFEKSFQNATFNVW